jgi:hypothetical protein
VEQKEAKILLALVFNKIETCKKIIYFEARATGVATVKEKESA